MARHVSVWRARVGALRRMITIEKPQDVGDDAGGLTRTWLVHDHVWSSVETISSSDALVENRPGGRLTHRVTMRWRADLDVSHRLRLGPRIFCIRAIADADDRRRRLALLVDEETP